HNPGSNLKLASGVARVPELLRAGVTVSLGTDGPASNNNLDMFEEMRLAALIHKGVSGDPTAVPASEALRLATEYGAKSIGL
ncbi:amidohydrolase family protein, partial [Bacillus cereus]|nr:amidohydrolase family protein [Bacillus cereus]